VRVRKNDNQTEQLQYDHRALGCRSSAARSSRSSPSNGSNLMKERRPRLCGCSADFRVSLWQRFLRYPRARRFVRSNRGAGPGAADRLGCSDQSQAKPARFVSIRHPPIWSTAPDTALSEQRDHKTYQVLLWNTDGLPFSGEDPRLVRVIRSKETSPRTTTVKANSNPSRLLTNGFGVFDYRVDAQQNRPFGRGPESCCWLE
jgi:hypothetical protein